MAPRQINRLTMIGLVALSSTALTTVLIGLVGRAIVLGRIPPPDPDEGAAAHIFQLSVAALLPVGLVFLASAEWRRPVSVARKLAFPAAALLLAFAILYYFETYHPGA